MHEQTDTSDPLHREVPGALAGSTLEPPSGHDRPVSVGGLTSERRRFILLLGLVALPFVVAAAVVASRHWTPAGDQAVQILKIDQVGTSRTPLLGAWSRWGWNHPGPWPTYVLAPFAWAFGAIGALIGTLAVNAASLVLAVVAGRRRGGLAAAGLVALGGLLIGFAQGPTVLMDLWNPFAGLFPLYALVVVAWSIGDRDWIFLPFMVALASFSVQAHIGYLPVVASLSVTGLLLSVRRRQEPPDGTMEAGGSRPSWRRPLLWSAVVLVVAWLPPLIEELGRGNISRITSYAIDAPEPAVGWRIAWHVFAVELGLPGAWVTGRQFDLFDPPASPIGAIVVVLATATLGAFAFRAGAASAARLAALGLMATLAAVVATSRIAGFPYDYLLAWWWVAGATVWLSLAWSTWTLLARGSPPQTGTMTSVVLAATAVISLGLAVRSLDPELPVAQQSAAVEELLERVEPQLARDTSYVVEWRDNRGFGYVATGIFIELERRGFDVVVPTAAGRQFESWQRGDISDRRLVISTGDDDAEFPPPPESVLIARYDPLSAGERAEADALWSSISEQAGAVAGRSNMVQSPVGRDALLAAGVDPDALDRFVELWDRGPAFVVYLAPGSEDGG